jgi:hypothetical protein
MLGILLYVLHTYTYIHMYVCMYVCMFLYLKLNVCGTCPTCNCNTCVPGRINCFLICGLIFLKK